MKTTSPRPLKRTPEEWNQVIEKAENSTLSIAGFCRQENICEQTFYSWKSRLRTRDAPAGFTPVVISQSRSNESPARLKGAPMAQDIVEISLRNGRVVRVHSRFGDPQKLQAILAAVEGSLLC